jgi:hypothetical protein
MPTPERENYMPIPMRGDVWQCIRQMHEEAPGFPLGMMSPILDEVDPGTTWLLAMASIAREMGMESWGPIPRGPHQVILSHRWPMLLTCMYKMTYPHWDIFPTLSGWHVMTPTILDHLNIPHVPRGTSEAIQKPMLAQALRSHGRVNSHYLSNHFVATRFS